MPDIAKAGSHGSDFVSWDFNGMVQFAASQAVLYAFCAFLCNSFVEITSR
jgi:hypothetical protein